MKIITDKNGTKLNNIDIKDWERVDEMFRVYRIITNDTINFEFLGKLMLKTKSMRMLNSFETRFPLIDVNSDYCDLHIISKAIIEIQTEILRLRRN